MHVPHIDAVRAATSRPHKLRLRRRPSFFPYFACVLQAQTVAELSNAQILHLLKSGLLSPHKLEVELGDSLRAVHVRRAWVADAISRETKGSIQPATAMTALPAAGFDHAHFYDSILNTNCEAVIGCVL